MAKTVQRFDCECGFYMTTDDPRVEDMDCPICGSNNVALTPGTFRSIPNRAPTDREATDE